MIVDAEADRQDAAENVEALNAIKRLLIAFETMEVIEGDAVYKWWNIVEDFRSLLVEWHGVVPVQQGESEHLDPLRHLPQKPPGAIIAIASTTEASGPER